MNLLKYLKDPELYDHLKVILLVSCLFSILHYISISAIIKYLY